MTGLENSLQGDTVSWLVGMLLLIMSVASWVLILWKSWLLQRASRDISRSTAAFWQSASLADASQRLQAFDRESLVVPLIDATISDDEDYIPAGQEKPQGYDLNEIDEEGFLLLRDLARFLLREYMHPREFFGKMVKAN